MKQVKIILGRFQPFTLGHLKIAMTNNLNGPDIKQKEKLREQPDLEKISKQKTVILAIDNPQNKVNDRRPFVDTLIKKELELVKKTYPEIENVFYIKSADICSWGELLKQNGYQASVWITGTDEFDHYKLMAMKVPEYEEHNRDNRDFKDACTKSFYIEEVKRNETSDDFISTISATKVRKALEENDKETFLKMMPKGADRFFEEFRKAVLNAPESKETKKAKKLKESKLSLFIESQIKPLTEFLKESFLFEGGHSIDGVSPIKGDLAKVVADEIIDIVSKEFKCKASVLGSTGKKREDQTSGDIDIALEIPWEDHEKVIDFVKKTWTESKFGNIVNQLHVFNIGYKYNDGEEIKFVQVDFMFVDDIEYAKFVYHSPSFINNESNFKGAWRSTLLRGIIACTPIEKVYPKFKEEKFEDGSVKTFWKLTFSQVEGLFADHKTYEGKTKKLSSPESIKEDREYLSKNIDEILHKCLGPECTREDCNSYESTLEFISSDKYLFSTVEQLKKIKEWLFTNYDLIREMSDSTVKEAEKLFNESIKYVEKRK